LLIEARQIPAYVDRAAVAAQRAARSTPSLRVGIVDAFGGSPVALSVVGALARLVQCGAHDLRRSCDPDDHDLRRS